MEDFVTYEIAVKLKEKGFREECLAYYTSEYTLYNNTICLTEDKCLCLVEIDYEEFLKSNNQETRWENICDAPTIFQVLKWLRETKNLEVVASFSYRNKVWGYQVGDMTLLEDSILSYDYCFPTYEEAALAGIGYVLDNLI